MNRNYPKILRNRKRRIERRLEPKNWEDQPRPMLKASNIVYEMAERAQGMNCGGIGALHLMVQRLGLGPVQKLIPICLRKESVIPLRQNGVFEKVQVGHLVIGDLDFGGVVFRAQGALDL